MFLPTRSEPTASFITCRCSLIFPLHEGRAHCAQCHLSFSVRINVTDDTDPIPDAPFPTDADAPTQTEIEARITNAHQSLLGLHRSLSLLPAKFTPIPK